MAALLLTALLVVRASGAQADESVQLDDGFAHVIDDSYVTLGSSHACALEAPSGITDGQHGAAVCWGTAGASLDAPEGSFFQISAAGARTCGITTNFSVRCWGGKDLSITAGNGLQFSQVSTGADNVCALRQDEHLQCWGASHHGQSSPPPGHHVQVSCGDKQCCSIRRDGTLACWGSSHGGLLSAIPKGQHIQLSVSSDHHACAITIDGKLTCWGSVVGPKGGVHTWEGDYIQVATGHHLTCAIRMDGSLHCIGEHRRLWAGLGAPPKDTLFSEISAHGIGLCGITAGYDRRVLCFGEIEPSIAAVPKDLEPAGMGPDLETEL